MEILKYTSSLLALMFSTLVVAAEDIDGMEEGKKLFEKHGCTNCHGQDGIHPTSKYVPVLKGKPTDYLFENAHAILSGLHKSKTCFMHDQFCIGSVKEEGCYLPPGNAELQMITAWLGGDTKLPEKKRTSQGLYVTSLQAHKQLQELGDKALFIDVRSRGEVAFLGMPTSAHANVPYMTAGAFDKWDEKKKTFKLMPNSEFVMRIEEHASARGLDKDSPIYLICRSGSRSAKAASLLNLAGYRQVFTVTDGFEGDKAKQGPRKGERVVNGWKNAGLPWSYKLDKTAMYWDYE